MAESYDKVMLALRQMRAEGKSRADAERYAESMGWTFPELESASKESTAREYLAPVVQGLTFGFGDELAAGVRSGLGMLGDYDAELAKERALLKKSQSNSPVLSTVSEIGGAMVPGVAMAPLAIGKGVVNTLLRTTGMGALEGAAYGAGKGDSAQSRLEGAAEGAAWGGAAAPIAAGAANLIGKGLRKGAAAIQNTARPQTAAAGRFNQALTRDSITRQQFNAQLDDLGRTRPGQARAMDAGGEAVATQAELLAQSPGSARSKIKPALEARQINQLERITNDLKTLTGSRETALQARNSMMAKRQAEATPFYQAAYQKPVEGQALANFVNEVSYGFGEQAWKAGDFRKALETAYGRRLDKIPPPQAIGADLQVVDLWKRQVDDMIGSAKRAGQGNKVRVLTDMKHRVMDPIRLSNGEYDEALKRWSGPSQFIDAIDDGANFGKMTAEEVSDFLRSASASEKEAFRVGAVTSLINRMEADRSKMADFTKFFRGEGMRKKMAELMPDQAAADKWSQIFQAEQGFTERTAQALSNSATARRMMARADAEGADVFDLLMDISSGSPGLMAMVRRWASGKAGALRESAMERSNSALADIHMARTPDEVNALLRRGTPVGFGAGPTRLRGGGVSGGASIAAPEPYSTEVGMPY